MARRKFTRFVQPIICASCHKSKLPAEGILGTGLCGDCSELASVENEHSDTNGEHYGAKPTNCPACKKSEVE